MAQSSGRVGAAGAPERFERAEFRHPRSGVRYRVVRTPDGIDFEFERTLAGAAEPVRGRRRLDFYIGSGAVGRSYAFAADRFLFQAPVSYYSTAARWDISPGFGERDRIHLGRPIEPECLACHATGVRADAGTQNRYEAAPFEEGGIGCERCHGSGARHVEAMARGGPGPGEIVHPARLDPERRDSVCAQCHLTGEARVARRGRSLTSFRPGDRLRDHVVAFVRPAEEGGGLRVTGHFEKLWASACKQRSGDRLWCGTCHDPHAVPAAAERAAYFRRKCLLCHEDTSCRAGARARAGNGDNCAACHMPRTPVVDVAHAAYTDHSIPRRARAAAAARPGARAARLIAFWEGSADGRDLALACAEVAAVESNEALYARAFELLARLEPELQGDPAALEQLGFLYDRRGDNTKAVFYYERALVEDPARVVSSVNLGGALARGGDLRRAIDRWLDALARSPGLELPRLYLAEGYRKLGLAPQARAAVRKGLEFFPDSPALLALLAQLEAK
jgi:Flp pilus assembly protein TadD